MKMFRNEEGFTLIELMVVVLIIGILVAIAIPVFNSAKANAQKRSCFANERTLEGAAHSYEASSGSLPSPTADVTDVGANSTNNFAAPLNPGASSGSYIAAMPNCPNKTNNQYDWHYASAQVVCIVRAGQVAADAHGHFQ